jgi:hypothetical protein
LSVGVDTASVAELLHGCQALDLSKPGNGCAPIVNYHGCNGSNLCAARGGCGFVHPAEGVTAGAQCGFALVKAKTVGDADKFSAPSNNACATLGGCAVPISAAQLLPTAGTMDLVNFVGDNSEPEIIGAIPFAVGELVHDVAWRAYREVMAHRDPDLTPLPEQPPPPSDIRLVFPPST